MIRAGGLGRCDRPAQAQYRRADPGLGGDERNAESAAQGHAPVADWAGADVIEFLNRVQDRPPFQDGLTSHDRVEVGQQRSQFPAG